MNVIKITILKIIVSTVTFAHDKYIEENQFLVAIKRDFLRKFIARVTEVRIRHKCITSNILCTVRMYS